MSIGWGQGSVYIQVYFMCRIHLEPVHPADKWLGTIHLMTPTEYTVLQCFSFCPVRQSLQESIAFAHLVGMSVH